MRQWRSCRKYFISAVTIAVSPHLQKNKDLPILNHTMQKHILTFYWSTQPVGGAPLTVDVICIVALSVCSAFSLVVNQQITETSLSRLDNPDFCNLELNCGNQRPIPDLQSSSTLWKLRLVSLTEERTWSRSWTIEKIFSSWMLNISEEPCTISVRDQSQNGDEEQCSLVLKCSA